MVELTWMLLDTSVSPDGPRTEDEGGRFVLKVALMEAGERFDVSVPVPRESGLHRALSVPLAGA